jgi:hypothetical protein
MASRLFWGDIHNHCGISYGHGSLERALRLARQQLDFVSVTGHAFWPDMPTNRERYGSVIDYHVEGFKRLHASWDQVQKTAATAEEKERFIAFPGYEWHSRAYGDHNIVYKGPAGPLIGGESLSDLRNGLVRSGQEFLLEPHHIGYIPGGRGINWSAFDPRHSPLVEVYSIHGCSESDEAPYPMLHTMGPRDHRSTIQAGLELGHKFGFVASTDQHSGYPGSYGEGRLAVRATGLTRDALWEAFHQRRTYAVTGDKMIVDFSINDTAYGGETSGPKRAIDIRAIGADFWDTIELVKNGRLFKRWAPLPKYRKNRDGETIRAKVRVEWGWFRPSPMIDWAGHAEIAGGRLVEVESCFRGEPVIRRDEVAGVEESIPHEITHLDGTSVAWRSQTRGNVTTRHPTTQSLILLVEMPAPGRIDMVVNGHRISHTLEQLLEGAYGHFTMDFPSPAVRVHRAVEECDYTFEACVDDDAPERSTDYYYLRLSQRNGQCGWITPVWVTS